MKKIYLLLITVALFLTSQAQTVTLNAVLSGKVTAADAKTNGDLTNICSSCDEGYLKYDLTSLPIGAVVTSASVKITAIAPSTSSGSAVNKITTTSLDAATAGSGFYSALSTAPAAFTGSWAFAALPNTFTLPLTAGGVSDLQNRISTGQVTYGVIRGSTNVYTFAGYNNGTVANQPQLVINYTVVSPTITYPPLSAVNCGGGNRTLTATITSANGVPTSGIGLPVLYFKINGGAYSGVQGVSIGGNQYTFSFGGAAVPGDNVFYYVVAQDNLGNVTSNPSAGAAGLTPNPPAAATAPTTPNVYTNGLSLGGTYTVGVGGTYTTLTAAVNAYNAGCLTGPVIFSLTTATYPTETFPIVINANAGASAVNTLTIRPAAGISPLISGTVANSGIIKINGGDYITIDGSNNGTNSRDLTIENLGAGTGIWIASTATDGATNNTFKNINARGLASSTTTIGGILIGGSVFGGSSEVPDNAITVTNNNLTRAQNGIYANGNAATPDQNWNFSGNTIGSATAGDKMSFRGMAVVNANNFTISGNTIAGVTTASTSTATGIAIFSASSTGVISGNIIRDIKNTNAGGYGAIGIYLTSTSTTAGIQTYNNFISDITGIGYSGSATAADNGYGIFVEQGAGYSIYYNTVNMNTAQSSAGLPAAMNIGVGVTAAGAIDLRDNIFSSSQGGTGERYAIYSAAPNTVFSNIDYNDYYTAAADLGFIGSNRSNLAAVQAGFGSNLNSQNGLPTFISSVDLHLQTPDAGNNTYLESKGTPVSVTTDIDGQSRPNGTAPDLGADEFVGAVPTCPGATGVAVVAGSITPTSANISWTGSGTFILEYGLTGFTPGTGNTAGTGGTLINPAVSPQAITGLTAATGYDVYIRQDCTSSALGYSPNSPVVSFITSVANDICANAIAIPCGTTLTGNNTAATDDPLPAVTCGSTTSTTGNNKGVWYTVTPVYSGAVTVATCGSSFDTYLRVYDGTCGAFTACMGFSDDDCGTSSSVTFTAVGGTTYYILLGGYGSSSFGAYTINATCPAPCAAPSAVAVNTITSTTANVTWTGTGTSILEYGLTGFTPGTGATAGIGGTVINPATSPQALSGLTPNTSYDVYVRQDCTGGTGGYSTNSIVINFTTLASPPVNDDATGAILLTLGSGCAGAPYTDVAATASAGEAYPSCSGPIASPVWFKFVAPASGSVRVSDDYSGGTLGDSKIAVFSATDPADYSTFNILSCDEDNGSTVNFLSVAYVTGLVPGNTYYIAVDKYSTGTSAGTFCLTVDELNSSMLSTTNNCSSSYQSLYNGGVTNYTGWVSLEDGSSKLIALVRKATGTNEGLFSAAQNINTGAVRQTGGVYYLDRNFRIVSAETNVDVQFFFLNSELAALNAVDAGANINTLGGAKQDDGTSACQNDFSTANGAYTTFTQTGNGSSTGGVSWITTNVPSFSNFYLYKASAVVPVSIEFFTGSKQGTANYLDWKVNCTSAPSVTLVLERSADGRSFGAIETQNATATRCLQEFNYTDASPLAGINYYRLKIITPDGASRYSNIVALLNRSLGFELISVAPNPVKNTTVLSITSVKGGRMDLQVTDVTGKQVMKQSVTVIAGNTAVNLDFGILGAGTYQITAIDANGERKTVRFVKF